MNGLLRLLVSLTCAQVATAASCQGQEVLLENPADPAGRGPYPVGSLLGSVGISDGYFGRNRDLTVEIWYPAVPGSQVGQEALVYDIREHVPAKQRKMLDDAANVTRQACDCFRMLPVADGVFPVLLMIHGYASFRTASLHQQVHWASRGFVVVAADHPGIQLKDLLGVVDIIPPPKTNLEADARGLLAALLSASSLPKPFAPLAGHLDMHRVGVAGHSAGGEALKHLGDVADVLVAMAGFAPLQGPRLKSTLVLAAANDTIVSFDSEARAYEAATARSKRFAAVDGLGHTFCTDLCWIGASAGGIVKIAEDHGIEVAKYFESLGENGCAYLNAVQGTHFLEPACGWHFVNFASTAAFEEVLRCDAAMAFRLRDLHRLLPVPKGCSREVVFDYREALDHNSALLV